MRTRNSILTLLFCLLLLGAGISCDRKNAGNAATGESNSVPARTVKVETAMAQRIERSLNVVGLLRPFDQAIIGAKVSGRLEALLVDLGDEVKEGQVLARLEARDYELQVKQSEAALVQARAKLGLEENTAEAPPLEKTSFVQQARAVLEEAEANHNRIKDLAKAGVISTADLQSATATHTVARTKYDEAMEEARNRKAILLQRTVELEIAKQKLADTSLRAPFDGKIQDRFGNLGEFLPPGTSVLTLMRMNPLRLRMEVPERHSASVELKQKIRVKIDGYPKEIIAELTRISPAITDSNRILVVEADLPNDGHLHPGAFARAEILSRDPQPVVTVPPQALVTFAGLEKVFIHEKGKAVERKVTTGSRGSNWVEIVTGIKAGDSVVLNPGNLQNGQPLNLDR